MLNIRTPAVFYLLMFLAVVPARSSTTFYNPGFESGISGWSVPSWEHDAPPVIDHSTVRRGRSALELRGGGVLSEGGVYQDLLIAPHATTVEVSGWIKTESLPLNWEAGVYAEFLGAGGKWISFTEAGTIAGKGGDTDWQKFTHLIPIPPGAQTVRYELRVRCYKRPIMPANTGTAWFDDARILQLDERGREIAFSDDGAPTTDIGTPSDNMNTSEGRTASAYGAPAGAMDNVLINPDFSEGVFRWASADWLPVVAATTSASSGGDPRGSVLTFAGKPKKEGWVYQDIPVGRIAASDFISGWIKTRALPSGWWAGIMVEFRGAGGSLNSVTLPSISTAGDANWTRISGLITVPPATTVLRIDLLVKPSGAGSASLKFGVISFADISIRPVVDPKSPQSITVRGFAPEGVFGVFLTSQRPSLNLQVESTFHQLKALTVRYKVLDFWNSIVFKGSQSVNVAPLTCVDASIDPPILAKTGFYSIHAAVYDGNNEVASSVSSFCVTTPMKSPNTFLGFTQYEETQVDINRIVGAGAVPLWMGWRSIEPSPGNFEFDAVDDRMAPFTGGGYRMIGAIDPNYTDPSYVTPGWVKTVVDAWRADHIDYATNPVDAYPPQYYDYWRDYVTAVARHFKGRIEIWQFIWEIDWHLDDPGGEYFYARLIQIGSQAIKQVDPNAMIGGIAVGTQDASSGYPVARKVWGVAGDSLDGLFLHPYVQPCTYAPGYTPPGDEKGGLRNALIGAQDLVHAHGKRLLAIDEDGVKVSSTLPIDCPTTKDAATAVARSLIIAKSVPDVAWYSAFMKHGEDYGDPGDAPGSFDYGYWFHDVPRPSVAAYATCARMLNGASAFSDIKIHDDIIGYVFSRGSGSLAAVWTILPDEVPLSIDLPQSCRICDLMGNQRILPRLPTGETTLPLSHAPIFLTSSLPPGRLASIMSSGKYDLSGLVATARPGSYKTIDLYIRNQTSATKQVEVTASLTGDVHLSQPTVSVTVPGDQMARVPFPFAGNADAYDGTFAARLESTRSKPVFVKTWIDLFPVRRVAAALTADDDLGTFANLTPIVLDSPASLMSLGGPTAAAKLWKGPNDLSMKVWLSWDDTNFYFVASVLDASFVQEQTGSSLFSQDGFQFGFDTTANAVDPDISGVTGFSKEGGYQYGIALTKDGPQGFCWVAAGANAAFAGKTTAFAPTIVHVSPTLTTYKFAIPWPALAPMKPKPGTVFGFNLNYMNADAPGDFMKYWMQLSPGLSEGKNPAVYRQFVLTE